jgi:hypothetical protein
VAMLAASGPLNERSFCEGISGPLMLMGGNLGVGKVGKRSALSHSPEESRKEQG